MLIPVACLEACTSSLACIALDFVFGLHGTASSTFFLTSATFVFRNGRFGLHVVPSPSANVLLGSPAVATSMLLERAGIRFERDPSLPS